MEHKNAIAGLKNAIELLEIEQAEKSLILKEQFNITYDNLKPVNMIKNTLMDAVSSPVILNNIVSATVGLASGYLTKRIVVGTSANIFRNIFGSILQLGVANMVANNPDKITSISQKVLHFISVIRENKAKKSDK